MHIGGLAFWIGTGKSAIMHVSGAQERDGHGDHLATRRMYISIPTLATRTIRSKHNCCAWGGGEMKARG
jgi:hypothetical protein